MSVIVPRVHLKSDATVLMFTDTLRAERKLKILLCWPRKSARPPSAK